LGSRISSSLLLGGQVGMMDETHDPSFDPRHAPERLRAARDAYERRAWHYAYRALLSVDESAPLGANDLHKLATAAYLIGRDLDFLTYTERLHRMHIAADDSARAARCAFWLALGCLFRGDAGQANAWTARGQRLVCERDCVERGYLLLPSAEQELRGGRAEAAQATAAEAAAIGERWRDADLTAAAWHVQGRALIHTGRVPSGLERLDETMLAVVAGELSPIMTGLMYCSVIDACREVYELERAREWTFALSRWCEQQSEMAAFTGTCLVHRAEIMQFQGAWSAAFDEACRACERATQAARQPPGAALYQQAEIHRLRGDYAKADAAYRDASKLGHEPQPGLALLRLAQGRVDAAYAAIRRLVLATVDRLQRARVLPAHVEIMLAANDLGAARDACRELEELARTFDTDVLRAAAAQAAGALALVEDDARGAAGPLRRAFELWQKLGAPYEAARVRALLAQACRALGDDEAATLEHDAACAALEQLGARPDAARLAAERRSTSAAGPLTARERDVLRMIAAGRTNKAIAAELSLSERTVDRHVSNILSKLGVPSRAAATARAFERRLL
jgi:DNA-binding CsgD family transcriptional regulator